MADTKEFYAKICDALNKFNASQEWEDDSITDMMDWFDEERPISDEIVIDETVTVKLSDFRHHRYYDEQYWYWRENSTDKFAVVYRGYYDSWSEGGWDGEFTVGREVEVQDFYFQ